MPKLSNIANITTYKDCARLCKDNTNCTQWTWGGPYSTVRFYCTLKKGEFYPENKFGKISGSSECDEGGLY